MASIKIKDREIPLAFTSLEMLTVQKEIGPMARTLKIATGRNPDDDNDTSWYSSAEHIEAAAKLIRILGNAGLDIAGQEQDLTDKMILRAMKPKDLLMAMNECMNAITEGMASEIPEKEEEGPVDVTLENMKKKDPKES